ncbi:MAG: hypothetical protein ACTTJ7_05140 [Treponema sp.]
MVRKYGTALMFWLCSMPFFAQEIYDDFLHFKVELYNAESEQAMQTKLSDYKQKLDSARLTEEAAVTLRTLFTLEQALFEKDANGKKNAKDTYLLLTKQDKACKAFMANKKNSEVNAWFLAGWADVKSRLTAFLSGQDMYTEANIARKLYLDALKQDKTFSSGYLSYGLWLFFAPPIAGGGEDAALKEFSKAVSYAKTPEEKYLALLYRSQAYVALEDAAKANADLRAANALIPNERFTQTVIKGNKNGKLFFE